LELKKKRTGQGPGGEKFGSTKAIPKSGENTGEKNRESKREKDERTSPPCEARRKEGSRAKGQKATTNNNETVSLMPKAWGKIVKDGRCVGGE